MSQSGLLNLSLIISLFPSIFPRVFVVAMPKVSDNLMENLDLDERKITPIDSDRYFSMKTYFRHLYTNMPENDFGSCGFVSLISCLSFYDSYYNDGIINEKFDAESCGTTIEEVAKKSPGVTKVRNEISMDGLTEDEINDYKKSFIISNKLTDFQYDLIYAYNRNVLKRSLDSLLYETSIGMWNYQSLLNAYYGENKITFNYVSSTIYGENAKSLSVQTQMKQYVYDMLDKGIPVVLHVVDDRNDKKMYYHSIVAYDYGINSLDCNFGYNNSYFSDINLNQQNYYITEAGRFDLVGFYETHSSNYVINGRPYCGCGHSE